MKSIFIVCALLVASIAALPSQDWTGFKQQFGKQYKSVAEEQLRRLAFEKNVLQIAAHNKRYEAGEVSFSMRLNQFSDMSHEEFSQRMLAKLPEIGAVNASVYQPTQRNLPDWLDWRAHGVVTPVKNQGSCGSCWSYGAVASMEGQWALRTGQLKQLSEQNLVDCADESWGNSGCSGGWAHNAMSWVISNGGINDQHFYPYEGVKRHCRFNHQYRAAHMGSLWTIEAGNEESLRWAVANEGPVSVGVYVSENFNRYGGGVFNDWSCGSWPNHIVTVVGYGWDASGGDYWLVKNSWDTWWGEGGYIRMSRNRNNQCLIASFAYFAKI
ncbi:crustapain-like [Drosophila busckii]|uniref:crustapain-like n=1 Tax=Drosophila busckii TaxID=30019 RepID=UPI00083EDF40|nr:crustapain-like [Drosophila busckii]